jgi:hypothetical protein
MRTPITVATILFAAAASAAAQPTTDAKAGPIIEQARKALGGGKLAGVSGLSASGTFRRVMSDREMSGELAIDLQLPDRFLRTESLTLMGDAVMTRESGVNGDQLLQNQKTSGGGPGMVIRMATPEGRDADAQALKAARSDFARYAVGFLLAAPPSAQIQFTYAGEAQAEDGKADAIDVKGADGFEARLFIDQATHKPVMLSFKGAAPRVVMRTQQMPAHGDPEQAAGEARALRPTDPPEVVEIQMFFSDYRSVDGVELPHHIARSVGGQPSEEWDIKKFKVNPAFKADTFQKR